MTADTRRLSRPRFSDLRLWLGVSLLVVSMVAGSAVLSSGGDSVTVLRAAGDLSAGAEVIDVESVVVPPSVADAGYATPEDLQTPGQTLRWPVPKGQLVPRAALDVAQRDDRRLVTVPVDPIRAPAGLSAGDIVDVWATAGSAADSAAAVPSLVLSNVPVVDVSADGSAVSGDLGVVLDVSASEVAALVTASRSGVIDLAAVPISAQVAQ